MFDPSPAHLLMLGLIVLLVMGPKRLPELARSLGHGMREFRGSLGGGSSELRPGPAGDRRDELSAGPDPVGASQATQPPVPALGGGELAAEHESAGVERGAA